MSGTLGDAGTQLLSTLQEMVKALYANNQQLTKIAAGASPGTSGVTTFNGRAGTVTLGPVDVSSALGFTPYSTSNPAGYQTAAQVGSSLIAYAPLASPGFSGAPTAPTPSPGDSSLRLATTSFVQNAIGGAQGTVSASTATTSLSPAGLASIVVTVGANTTINVQPGTPGQVLRLEVKQDATGGRTVALGATIAFGADLTAYAPSTAANARDLLQLINAGGSAWMLVAVSHGFGV